MLKSSSIFVSTKQETTKYNITMLLLRIKSIRNTSQSENLGLRLEDSTRIVDCTVNLSYITHFESDVDDPNITNIRMTSGALIKTPMSSRDFTLNLMKMAAQHNEDDDYDEGDQAKSDDNE